MRDSDTSEAPHSKGSRISLYETVLALFDNDVYVV